MAKLSVTYFRSFVFGVEDSLVSTVGLLSGIAIAGVPKETILLTGLVLIFVEAFSMGAGSFLSEHSGQEYSRRAEVGTRHSILAALVMLFSYFLAGFIPLLPYLLFPVSSALLYSIAVSLIALFALGAFGARASHISVIRHGLQMLIVGGIAIAVGVLVGRLVHGL